MSTCNLCNKMIQLWTAVGGTNCDIEKTGGNHRVWYSRDDATSSLAISALLKHNFLLYRKLTGFHSQTITYIINVNLEMLSSSCTDNFVSMYFMALC